MIEATNQGIGGTTCPCGGEISEEELMSRLDEVIAEYKGTAGALMPVLQQAQAIFGYLPESVMHRISDALGEPRSKVFGVVTFYSFFSTVPRGKYLIRVCLGTACYVLGAKEVLAAMKEQLGIDVGQTTEDRLFSLDVGRCFGACGLAPILTIDEDVHKRVRPEDIPGILAAVRNRQAAGQEEKA